jgi:Zn-dependent oligopeptidase
MSDIKNSLLDFSDLPRFDTFQPEYVSEAIASLISEAQAVVATLEVPSAHVTWENFVAPLEETAEKLSRAWGIVGHLNAVVDTPALRATYNENQPKVTEFWTALAQNLALFEKYKAIQESPAYAQLSATRQRIIENAIRDFRLGGAELSDEKKRCKNQYGIADSCINLSDLSAKPNKTDQIILEMITDQNCKNLTAKRKREEKQIKKRTLNGIVSDELSSIDSLTDRNMSSLYQ